MQFTWGCELEFGDIPRWVDIPSHLGSWEYHETDIVNQRNPYWGIASDPLGKDPPFGGEINTVPTKTWKEQILKIHQLIKYFTDMGYPPTTSCVQEMHIHVGMDKAFYEKSLLKNIILYCLRNQNVFLSKTSRYQYDPRMNNETIDFLLNDGARITPVEVYLDMIKELNDNDNTKETLSLNRVPFDDTDTQRYGINLRSILYNETIEFRSFRSTLNLKEIGDSFSICEIFMSNAIKDNGTPIEHIFNEYEFSFPVMNYDHELFESWQKTKKERRLSVLKPRLYLDLVI